MDTNKKNRELISALSDGEVPDTDQELALAALDTPDGRQAWLEMRAFPSRDGLAIFFRDISDRKASEEQLKQAQAELIHASRVSAMGTMAATLAHELAQPLLSAGAYLDAALRTMRNIQAR